MKHKIRTILDRYGHNQNDLAELLGITYQSVSIKLNGHKDFTQTEIFKIIYAYNLKPEDVMYIFFDPSDRFSDIEDKQEEEDV